MTIKINNSMETTYKFMSYPSF